MRRTIVGAAAVAGLLAVGGAPGATAQAAPPNDTPQGALAFQAVTAENGTPAEREATALLADATPDAGVPRCLGGRSFARTVWFRVESAATPRRIKVEASGQTTAAPDLAAFVQPPGATDTAPALAEPQACDGPGALALEGASVVELHVPAGHHVLIQAGRSADQAPENALLDLDATALAARATPVGDTRDGAPRVALGDAADVALAGATLTAEDPAQPACPAVATVWRRVDVPGGGPVRVTARGADVGTLTAFGGGDALDCSNRTRGDTLALVADAPAAGPLWVRIGAERQDAGAATLRVERAPGGGGAGGPGGAGGGGGAAGGASSACTDRTRPTLRLVGGTAGLRGATRGATRSRTLRGTAADRGCGGKVRRVEVALQRRSGAKCRAVGRTGRPGRRRSCARLTWVRASGTTRWSFATQRALRPGRYVLRVRARDAAGNTSTTTRTTFTVKGKDA